MAVKPPLLDCSRVAKSNARIGIVGTCDEVNNIWYGVDGNEPFTGEDSC